MDQPPKEYPEGFGNVLVDLLGLMNPDGREVVATWDKLPISHQEAVKECVAADLISASFTSDGRVWCKLTPAGEAVRNNPDAIFAAVAANDRLDLELVPEPSHDLWQLVDQWQTLRKLESANSDQAKRLRISADKSPENSDPEQVRELADAALRRSVDFAERALALRWKIINLAESTAASLGNDCPGSLRRFYVLLRPHGDEEKALAIWPDVQVDLETVYAAKGHVVRPFTGGLTGKAGNTSPAEPPKSAEAEADNPAVSSQDRFATEPEGGRTEVEPAVANESLRAKYHDPDNYWRNVWLYEQRKDGKKNRDILDDLKTEKGREFSLLETENALRTAIESIARHHSWLELKGKPGRPKAAGEPD